MANRLLEQFEDTEGVVRSRKSNDKGNNDLQNTTQKTNKQRG